MSRWAAVLCSAGVLARVASAADTDDVWKKAGAGDGLRQAFERTIYALKDSGRGTWRGENRAQRMTLEFDSAAARLRHPDGSLDIRLTGFGYGERLAKPAAATLSEKGNRLEYRRGDLTEWYENRSEGLEQGFTLTHRPADSRRAEPLTIALGVTGDLAPAQTRKGGAVLLKSAGGVVLRYEGLTARDARGRILPSRMEARGHEIRLLVEDRDAQYPLVVDPTWSEQAKLTASDGEGSDLFGVSVAVSGGTALIGAPQHQVGMNSNQGEAYVFVQSGTIWNEQAKLTASDGAADDQFGVSVAVSGGTAVIGAYQHTVGAKDSQGEAYVFVQSGTLWNEQAKLTASEGAAGDHFGVSVAVSGGTAVIGADHRNASQGAAYVFVQSGTIWNEQPELTASDGAALDLFGASVAVSGGTALIGAYAHQVGTNNAQGAAYVFVQSGTSWSQQAELTASDGMTGDEFGRSVAVSGDTVLIGADGSNLFRGAAYVFVQSGTSWTQQAELTASDGAAGDQFGASVAVSGSTAVIGANQHTVVANSNQGAAYAFTQSGTIWSQQPAALTASDGAASDFFGVSVAISGGKALIGAFGHNSLQGAAYAFVVSPPSLSVSATHSSPIFQAGPGTITLTVFNTIGPTAAAATVSDTIDSAFTINSASSGCLVTGQTVTCTLASGSSDPSTAFRVYVTASAAAPASISNTATLTDIVDTITSGSSSDTIPIGTLAPLVDFSLTQILLSGSTDTGNCSDVNRTLTATDLLRNTGESTLTNPYAVNVTLSQGNTLLSQSADSAIVAPFDPLGVGPQPGAMVTFTFHIRLASCNTFQLFFDVRSN